MYQRVKAHLGVRTLYSKRLVREGVIDEAGVALLIEERIRRYEDALARAKEIAATQKGGTGVPHVNHAQDGRATIKPELDGSEVTVTAVEADVVQKIARQISVVPEG